MSTLFLLQDVLGTILMTPSLFSFQSWRLAVFMHHLRVNMLWKDFSAWHPLTVEELATMPEWQRSLHRLVNTTPLKLLSSIAGWWKTFRGFDLRESYPESQKDQLLSWAVPAAFVGLVFPSLIALGGVSGKAVTWDWYMAWSCSMLLYIMAPMHDAPHIRVRYVCEVKLMKDAQFNHQRVWCTAAYAPCYRNASHDTVFLAHAGLVNCFLGPWLVFHMWLSTLTALQHTAPHIPFTPEGDEYDVCQAVVSGTVSLRMPHWLEFILNYPNYNIVEHVNYSVPYYHAKQAAQLLREKLWPYMTEATFKLKLVTNLITKWQVCPRQLAWR